MLPKDVQNETATSVVIFGATGQLALRKIFPALWSLYRDNRLPQSTHIYTFSRTKLMTATFRLRCIPFMSLKWDRDCMPYNNFWKTVTTFAGDYKELNDYKALTDIMLVQETKRNMFRANRIFYLATPPIIFDAVTLNISRKCMSQTGWNRIIIEKPFARSDTSYKSYQMQLCQIFMESQIYMIDHYLSKHVIQTMLALRFANRIWRETWNNQHIAAVMISVKCEQPVLARADYFNSYGIIRDIVTNHMMQLLAFIAMEQPFGNTAEDLRNERLRVLKDVVTVHMSDVVLAQYINNGVETDPLKCGYSEHHYINKDSTTPTFFLGVLHIRNKRWSDVPFILRAGKALNDSKTEVRIQFKPVDCELYEGPGARNELVLRLAPTEEVFMRLMFKSRGEQLSLQNHQLPLTVKNPLKNQPTTYASLLLDVFAGNQLLFMSSLEQAEIWRIFSPLLAKIKTEHVKPIKYTFGSRGPIAAYRKAVDKGFVFYSSQGWYDGGLRRRQTS